MSKFGRMGESNTPQGGGDNGGVELRVAQEMVELIDIANREGEQGRPVDVHAWIKAVHEAHPSLRWGDVIRVYDSPMRQLPDTTWSLRALANILSLSPSPAPSSDDPRSNRPAPPPQGFVSSPGGTSAISGLWSPWANPLLQFTLVDRLVYLAISSTSSQTSTDASFHLSSLPSIHKLVLPEDASHASPTIKSLATSVQSSAWNCAELVKTLIRLGAEGGGEVQARAHELLDRGCKSNPELMLIGLIQIEVSRYSSRVISVRNVLNSRSNLGSQKPWNALHAELTARLLSTFLAGHPSHQLVFLRLHQLDRQFLYAALRDFYAESEMNVTRIVDIAQDLKALDEILDSLRPFELALDMAALASRREYLNLDKWLTSQIKSHGGGLVRATLEFVGHKVGHELNRQEMEMQVEPTTLALNAATIAILMRVSRAK